MQPDQLQRQQITDLFSRTPWVKRQGILSLKMTCYSRFTSASLSNLLCKNVPQHIFPEISHLWKLQCVLHFGSFWHLNDARFETAFELLYKKKVLCLLTLPPASMFCLLPMKFALGQKKQDWFLRVLDPGHRRNFFKQRFQLIWLIWNCQALRHTHKYRQ